MEKRVRGRKSKHSAGLCRLLKRRASPETAVSMIRELRGAAEPGQTANCRHLSRWAPRAQRMDGRDAQEGPVFVLGDGPAGETDI